VKRHRRVDPRALAEVGLLLHLHERTVDALPPPDRRQRGNECARQHPIVLDQLRSALLRHRVPSGRRIACCDRISHVQQRQKRPRQIVDAIEPDRLRNAPQRIRHDVAVERERLVAAHIFELVERVCAGDHREPMPYDTKRLGYFLQRLENRDRRIRERARQRRIDISDCENALQQKHRQQIRRAPHRNDRREANADEVRRLSVVAEVGKRSQRDDSAAAQP